MHITRENYEAFFLDFYEGNLTESQAEELMDFLAQHPDLKEEFESFELVFLPDEVKMSMPGKGDIKKPEHARPGNYSLDQQMIAYFEGDLDEKSSSALLAAVAKDPSLQKNFALFSKVRLQPDKGIIFAGKSGLKRYPLGAFMPAIRRFAVAAAVIAFLAGIFFMMPRLDDTPDFAHTLPLPDEATVTPEETIPTEETRELPAEKVVPEFSPVKVPAREPVRPIQAFSRHTMPEPLDIAGIGPRRATALTVSHKPENIEQREEFKWVSFANLNRFTSEEEETPAASQEREYTTLAGLAYSGIERTTGINIENVQNELSNRRPDIWDLAGAGLSGLSKITGTQLNVEHGRDENGRLNLLAVGERFRVER
ncbi:MAG: hypothetical protein K0B37_08375 [Bacteroidales bacterium]|nr:hypothetical protein [Bacteroidales bacterium]